MIAKYDGRCQACEGEIKAGEEIFFNPGDGAYHVDCWENYDAKTSAGITPAELEERLHSLSDLPVQEAVQKKKELAAELRAANFSADEIKDAWLRNKIARLLERYKEGE